MTNAGLIRSNIGKIGLGIGTAAIIGGVVAYAARRRSRKKARVKRKRRYKSVRKRTYKRKGRYRKTPHTAAKRRDTSHKRIRYTKNGQPYIIMGSGKARFIKKKGAKTAHKRKGGRY